VVMSAASDEDAAAEGGGHRGKNESEDHFAHNQPIPDPRKPKTHEMFGGGSAPAAG
jgi:hypothetical protein